MIKRLLFHLSFYLSSTFGIAQARQILPFNDSWQFYDAYNFEKSAPRQTVTLPHTWNFGDGTADAMEYKRTAAFYEKNLNVPENWRGKRIFIRFEGANSVADLWVNNRFITRHKGGYTAFATELTGQLRTGDNKIQVLVSNAYRTDVLPLHGDFNVYGGLHRPVSILVTEENCITPLDDGGPGIYIQTKGVTEKNAQVEVLTKLSLLQPDKPLSLRSTVYDAANSPVASVEQAVTNPAAMVQQLSLPAPQLWMGKQNPYLYSVKVELLQNERVVDEQVQPLGIRTISVDPDKGFFLNGSYLDLFGFGKHDDFYRKGSAGTAADYNRDMALVNESGATALRLTHYPHNAYFYTLCDSNGLVVWTEIPFVGPGGYAGTGYVKDAALEESILQNAAEMVKQYYNHPSVCFWGLGNELLVNYDDPQPFLRRLNQLVKTLDSGRLTAYASNVGTDLFTGVSDLLAWNKYYGWYGGQFAQIGKWADETHAALPRKPVGISEYGAGASPFRHAENLTPPNPKGRMHPEEWQTAFHEAHWQALVQRPFLWCKFIWAFADFSSSIRTEGDEDGINDKGLITYDRKVKKDAFYFYKANWNKAPMIYIAERRFNQRTRDRTLVKVYSNCSWVELFVNGKSLGKKQPDAVKMIVWPEVQLAKGQNTLVARYKHGKTVLEDQIRWTLQ